MNGSCSPYQSHHQPPGSEQPPHHADVELASFASPFDLLGGSGCGGGGSHTVNATVGQHPQYGCSAAVGSGIPVAGTGNFGASAAMETMPIRGAASAGGPTTGPWYAPSPVSDPRLASKFVILQDFKSKGQLISRVFILLLFSPCVGKCNNYMYGCAD